MNELNVEDLDLESLIELEEILKGMNDELSEEGDLENE